LQAKLLGTCTSQSGCTSDGPPASPQIIELANGQCHGPYTPNNVINVSQTPFSTSNFSIAATFVAPANNGDSQIIYSYDRADIGYSQFRLQVDSDLRLRFWAADPNGNQVELQSKSTLVPGQTYTYTVLRLGNTFRLANRIIDSISPYDTFDSVVTTSKILNAMTPITNVQYFRIGARYPPDTSSTGYEQVFQASIKSVCTEDSLR